MTVLAPDSAARSGSAEDVFLADAQRYRRELVAHCYRMTGSLHDAEDLVQETYLRAWKSYRNFEGKSSVRTWLYRIATNTCLTALDGRKRRPLPSGLGQAASDPTGDIVARHEIAWLEPLPDAPREDPSDPSVIAESRESVRLAFIAALQHLPPRQRAVLVLREVLQWKAAEVGTAVGASTAAVNSLLQRARAALEEIQPHLDDVAAPDSPETSDLLARYVEAFENYDMDRLVELFTDDAVWEMPPFDGWYRGPQDIVTLSKTHCPAEKAGDMRFLTTTANGQPVAALYMINRETGVHEAFQLHVLEVRSTGIAHVVAFKENDLFAAFGLPATLT
jgi:RNA polymerase sigma-70 factor, ECF subfamily